MTLRRLALGSDPYKITLFGFPPRSITSEHFFFAYSPVPNKPMTIRSYSYKLDIVQLEITDAKKERNKALEVALSVDDTNWI